MINVYARLMISRITQAASGDYVEQRAEIGH